MKGAELGSDLVVVKAKALAVVMAAESAANSAQAKELRMAMVSGTALVLS